MANVIDFSIYHCSSCGRRRESSGCSYCHRSRVAPLPEPRPELRFLIGSIALIALAVCLMGLLFSMGR